jgi:hypothetical protein
MTSLTRTQWRITARIGMPTFCRGVRSVLSFPPAPSLSTCLCGRRPLVSLPICGIWEDRAEERKKVIVLRELHRAIIYTTR